MNPKTEAALCSFAQLEKVCLFSVRASVSFPTLESTAAQAKPAARTRSFRIVVARMAVPLSLRPSFYGK